MRRCSTLILVLILVTGNLLSTFPPAAVAQQAEFPAEYVGTWEGTGFQTDADGNADGEWTITLTLTGGPAGAIAGTVNYPGLGCSGELTYLGFDTPAAQGLLFREDITVGENLCIDHGTFTLSLNSSTTLYFYWQSPDDPSSASGTLSQVGGTTAAESGTGGTLTLSSGVCYGSEDEPVTANYVVIYPDSGAFELPGGCRSSASRAGYSFTITAADSNGSTATAITNENGTFDLDLVAGEYTVTEDASGLSTTVTVTTGSSVTVALMYYAPSGSSVDVTLNAGGNNGTENWQQTTWEGLTISYPPDHTFYPSGNTEATAGERASAALQPDDCTGTGMDCPILGFGLYANDEGLSARDWADNWSGLIARNFRDITIAGQTGVAFETGNPDEYPGESSTFIVPIGTEMLEISGVGYQDVVEQIVASITVSAPTAGEIEYFALGDSIASGHGLMDDETACRRSDRAYPYRVAAELRQQGQSVIFPPENHLACSGATALEPADVLANPYKWLHHQVSAVENQLDPQRPTLVTITIGANDFHWTDPKNFLSRMYRNDDSTYNSWVDGTASAVVEELRVEVGRLLAHPNVTVVITEVHNPFNRESKFFKGSFETCGGTYSPIVGTFIACYERTVYAVLKLNLSYRALVKELAEAYPARVALAYTSLAFSEHEAPTPSCGNDEDAPDYTDTWIQHADDPHSNSQPFLHVLDEDWEATAGAVITLEDLRDWTGDCFHPNIFGAIGYARAVLEAAATTSLDTVLRGARGRQQADNLTTGYAAFAGSVPPTTFRRPIRGTRLSRRPARGRASRSRAGRYAIH